MNSCDVCRELNGDVDLPGGFLWECELAVGFHVPPLLEPEPQLGHLLIAPRRHADTWADLTQSEAAQIGVAAAKLGAALRQETRAERLYSAVIGHHSAHFHLHLFPRYPGTPPEFSWTQCEDWSGSPRGGADRIAAFVEQLRTALAPQ
ncbi:MAG TPA: HIT family protein [Solirubrobacteraceae bacterium]|nr:HIT family protein [Solirubrobacteraceae bacterium]